MDAYITNVSYPNSSNILDEVKSIGVDSIVEEAFCDKFIHYTIKINDIKTPWANILKQEALSIGSDLAVSKHTYSCKNEKTDALISLSKDQYQKLLKKLKKQYFMDEIRDLLENLFVQKTLTFKDKRYSLNKPIIFGVLNITPDSFSDGGKFYTKDSALKQVKKLINAGADIIDIGGESTRPGAKKISVKEELERILPIIAEIKKNFDIPISVDTNKVEVAKVAIEEGISLLNDVSGGIVSEKLQDEILKNKLATIVMLNKSTKHTGSSDFKDTQDPIKEYIKFYRDTAEKLNKLNPDSLIFDPGIGFSWSIADTKKLLSSGFIYSSLPFKTMLGISRKSFFGKHLNIPLEDRDIATVVLSAKLIREGVKIFRTHDVHALDIAKRLTLYY